MATPKAIREMGSQLAILMDDGSKMLAYPTTGGLWRVRGAGEIIDPPVDPPAGGALYNPWASYGVTGTWEDHASYSQGGLDYPLGFGTTLLAPATGTLEAGTWTDAAGRRQVLRLNSSFARKLPKSGTHMNGASYEAEGPMVAIVFQHMSEFGNTGAKAQGESMGKSGASASPSAGEYGGDVHLHVHGLDANGARLDIWKFF